MEYFVCVLDFEATCWENSENKEQMEIIEFPSVLYKITESTHNTTYEFVSEFAEYVKPTAHPILSPFCTELTGITQQTVDSAQPFHVVYGNHLAWLNAHIPPGANFIMATCGKWDLQTQLVRELKKKKLPSHRAYKSFINVKAEFEHFYKTKARGMPHMLRHLHLPLIGRHHSGIDDTRNIAQILLKMVTDGHTSSNFEYNYV
jgi:ERI1 exoribonuclease 3